MCGTWSWVFILQHNLTLTLSWDLEDSMIDSFALEMLSELDLDAEFFSLFERNWMEFELFYSGKKDAIEDIKDTWLPWKDKFASAGLKSTCILVIVLPRELKVLMLNSSCTVTRCTSHFMATMGLPCTHKIVGCLGMTIPLDIVHPHWRIDTLSLNKEVDSSSEGNNNFSVLLDELCSKYQTWPLSKQELVTSMIAKLVNESDIYFEPVIQRPKGRPPKAKKKKGKTSTSRDPSKFKLVDSS
ncbi:hypothetical protein Tco_0937887 [Tanacetum coccineum]|uniref:SWIM-type domain-containing protein n=1 Tax=Tanacetum coccineum TaxID=301880 RepID=A0ABQ5DG96_9ASTR